MLLRLLLVVGFLQMSHAQKNMVKGVVFSKGKILEGASVIVYGSKIGTITDASGNFELHLSNIKNPRIIISYLGHKSFIKKINAKETLSGHYDEVFALDWAPNGERVASGSKDRIIKIWQN